MERNRGALMVALEDVSGCKSKTGILSHAGSGGEEGRWEDW